MQIVPLALLYFFKNSFEMIISKAPEKIRRTGLIFALLALRREVNLRPLLPRFAVMKSDRD